MSNNPAGSSRKKKDPPPKTQVRPKFSTPSEELLQYLKTLGYDAPKNLKAEHLDYMFKDEKSAHFVKVLMSTIKPENVLTEDEVEQFDQLKKDGMVLYGKDLERAVKNRTALNKKKIEDDRTEALQTEELQRLINLRQQEIAEIQKQHQVLRNISEKKLKSEESKEGLRSQYKRELNDLDIAIQVGRKRVIHKLDKLKELKAAVFNKLQDQDNKEANEKLIFYWDWDSIFEYEDKLTSLTEAFIVDHVPNLIIESEGYHERCEEENKIEEAIEEYVAAFERLRHCIVYEKGEKVKLTLEFEEEQAKLRMMKNQGVIKSWKRGVDMKQVEKDLEARNEDQGSIMKQEYDDTLKAVREHALLEVDNRFHSLVESRNRAKRRLDIFIFRLYEITEAQKLRIDLARHLMQKAIHHVTDIGRDLMNLENRIAGLNLNGKLAQKSEAITISSHEGGSASHLQSFQDSYNTSGESNNKSSKGFSIDALENVEHQEELKKLSKQVNHMRSKLERLKTANSPCNQVHVLKKETQEKMVVLDAMQEEHSTSQSVADKSKLLEAIQTALAKHSLHFTPETMNDQ